MNGLTRGIITGVLLISLPGCLVKESDIGPVCQRDCTIINGFLTTGDGTEPLPNARLLIRWEYTPQILGGIIRKKAIATTDENGYYELSFWLRDEELDEGLFDAEITVDVESYFLCGGKAHSFFFIELKRDTTISVDYYIPRKAYVEVDIVNIDEIRAKDHFYTDFSSKMGVEGKQSCGSLVIWHNGLPLNPVREVAAEQPVIVEMLKKENDLRTISYDTINLSVGQKIKYAVEF